MRRSRKAYQSLRSASVGVRRIARARDFADDGMSSRIGASRVFYARYSRMQRLTLTPTLSRKRERGRAVRFINAEKLSAAFKIPSPACGRRWPEGPDEGKPRPHP